MPSGPFPKLDETLTKIERASGTVVRLAPTPGTSSAASFRRPEPAFPHRVGNEAAGYSGLRDAKVIAYW
jgi:hypothetical protein